MSRTRSEIVDAIKSSIGANETSPEQPQVVTTASPSEQPVEQPPVAPQDTPPEQPPVAPQSINPKDLKKEIKKAFKLLNSNPSFPLILNKQVMNSMDDLQRTYGELTLQESNMKATQREAKKMAKRASLERKRSEFLDKYKDHAEELQMDKTKDDYPEDEYRIQDGVVRRLGRVCGVVSEEKPDRVIEVPKLSKHDIDTFLDTHKDYILDRLKENDKSKSKTIVGEFLQEKANEFKSKEPAEQVMYKGTNSFSNGFSNKVIEQWFSRFPNEEPKITQSASTQQASPQEVFHVAPQRPIPSRQFMGLNPALFNR